MAHKAAPINRYVYHFTLFSGYKKVKEVSYKGADDIQEEIKKLFLYVLENEKLSLVVKVSFFNEDVLYTPLSKAELYQLYKYL